MKIFFRRIHLYLSLAAGLVILIACLTGAVLVFEKDLQMALNKDRYYVTAGAQHLPADSLIASVKKKYAAAKVNGIKLYGAKDRSAEISVTLKGKKEAAKGERQPGYTIFVNPYTGAVLEQYSYRETFFYQVFALHRWLLGSNDGIGKYIVGIATLIFLFIILTGIILWWPKTRKVLQQRLTLKWGAGWKRINHDLHIVLGFYSAIFLFIFAFTGLAWSFEWFNKGIYKVTASPLKAPPPPNSVYMEGAKKVKAQLALDKAKEIYPVAQFYSLSMPKDSVGTMTIQVLGNNAVHESATDAVYIDQYAGTVAGTQTFSQRSLGAKVRSAFKPVHTGSIWGTPSKIIAFIVCLFGVSFPITGTIMWINRTRKKGRKARRELAEMEGAHANA